MSVDIVPDVVLAEFIADEVVDEVVGLVKPGKEAVVYLARKNGSPPRLYAAKIYKDVIHRSFRDDATYRAGTVILDERERRAYEGRTRLGRAMRFSMWMSRECAALQTLGRAGADVPGFVGASGNAVLMEYIGDEEGPAPLLRDADLAPADATRAFEQIVSNLELFIECNLVHGDLSPFNILWWRGRATIIDFPQASDLRENPNAPELLVRDVRNVCDFFARRGVRASPREVVRRLRDVWPRWVRPPWAG